jgi:hypothetical protein
MSQIIFFPWCQHFLSILHSLMLMIYLSISFEIVNVHGNLGWFCKLFVLEWSISMVQFPHNYTCTFSIVQWFLFKCDYCSHCI